MRVWGGTSAQVPRAQNVKVNWVRPGVVVHESQQVGDTHIHMRGHTARALWQRRVMGGLHCRNVHISVWSCCWCLREKGGKGLVPCGYRHGWDCPAGPCYPDGEARSCVCLDDEKMTWEVTSCADMTGSVHGLVHSVVFIPWCSFRGCALSAAGGEERRIEEEERRVVLKLRRTEQRHRLSLSSDYGYIICRLALYAPPPLTFKAAVLHSSDIALPLTVLPS